MADQWLHQGPLARTLQELDYLFEALVESTDARAVVREHLRRISAYTAIHPAILGRFRGAQPDLTMVLHEAITSADTTGDGWVRITRDEGQRLMPQFVPTEQVIYVDKED